MPVGPYQTQGRSGGLSTAVYLDHNATTPTDPAVVEAMQPYFTDTFANPSSGHRLGAAAAAAVRAARRRVQALLGAGEDGEIVFTSGGTEADNTALYQAVGRGARDELIVSAVEHPAVLNTARALEKTFALKLRIVGVDGQGRLDRTAFARALGPKTALVSIMAANNETGNLYPVAEMAAEAHAAGALFHTDAVQIVGKAAQSLVTAIDLLSLSAHKFHGPKGIGALYVRAGLRLAPLIHGGRQERGRRAGTENLPAIVGLGAAAELALARLPDMARIAGLRDRLEAAVTAAVPGAVVLGEIGNRVAGTSLIGFEGAESEVVLHRLDAAGICASAGSACQAGSIEPSHVVRAMRLPYTLAQGAVRFSLSHTNADADIDRVLAVLPAAVAEARAISPFAGPLSAAG